MNATTKKVIEAYIQETPSTRGMCLSSETTYQKEFYGVSELMNKSCNNRVDAEKPAGSRVLLKQHPRPSRFPGYDSRYAKKKIKTLLTKRSL